MTTKNAKVEVTVEHLMEASAGSALGEPSVIIETESTVDGTRRDTAIEVRDADAPTVAAALLDAEVARPTAAQDLPGAVRCLAAGLVQASSAGQVRLHLQFESGQVLPIEISVEAAVALARALREHTGIS